MTRPTLDGELRFVDDPETEDTGLGSPPIIDMGAHEFQNEEPTCPGDVNDDDEVDFQGLLIVLGHWGLDPELFAGDANGDGESDSGDLLLLLSQWGPCG